MLAMLLTQPKERLRLQEVPLPEPQNHEVRLKIFSCGVCRTDLHIADGELPSVKLPLILGHQIVGRVEKLGKEVSLLHEGERIGVPWLRRTPHASSAVSACASKWMTLTRPSSASATADALG